MTSVIPFVSTLLRGSNEKFHWSRLSANPIIPVTSRLSLIFKSLKQRCDTCVFRTCKPLMFYGLPCNLL